MTELQMAQVFVNAIFQGNQFLMGSLFGNHAFVENQNLVGTANGRKTVGNDDARSSFHQDFQGFLNQFFAFAVQG